MNSPGSQMLDSRTETALRGVDQRLVDVFRAACCGSDPTPIVTEGLRTLDRQKELYRAGATRTLNSKHLTGRAIDVAFIINGQARWDWPLYQHFADRMKREAKIRGYHIAWGGDWPDFKDGPHFEIE